MTLLQRLRDKAAENCRNGGFYGLNPSEAEQVVKDWLMKKADAAEVLSKGDGPHSVTAFHTTRVLKNVANETREGE